MIEPQKIGGVILAGGQSRRMQGHNKSFVTLGDKPMIVHALERLQAQLSNIAINANDDLEAYQALGIPVISDAPKNYSGPLAGVASAMAWGKRIGLSHVVTVATDTPFFPKNLALKLATLAEPNSIVIARSDGFKHPTFGLWPTHLHQDLNNWLTTSDTMKVMAYIMSQDHNFVDFEFKGDHDPFFNINTPEDLASAETLLLEKATQ